MSDSEHREPGPARGDEEEGPSESAPRADDAGEPASTAEVVLAGEERGLAPPEPADLAEPEVEPPRQVEGEGDDEPAADPPAAAPAETRGEAAADSGAGTPAGRAEDGEPAEPAAAEAAPPAAKVEAAADSGAGTPAGRAEDGEPAEPAAAEAAGADVAGEAVEAATPPRLPLEVVEKAGEPPAPRLPGAGYTVLVVGGSEAVRVEVHDALGAHYEVSLAPDPAFGHVRAKQCAPDVIVLEGAGVVIELIESIRSDPLTDFIPILVLVEEADLNVRADALRAGATDVLVRPLEQASLRHLVRNLIESPVLGGGPARVGLGEATLDEVVRFVGREVERSVLEAAGPGAGALKIQLGRGGDLMGALWAFVARLRDIVDRGAEGRVVFRSLEPGRVDVMALTTGREPEAILDEDVVDETIAGLEALEGLRVVVADDDPAVRWAFTTVLGEVGMDVEAVANGVSALRAIRAERPDVVITDILMPELDGWELLRVLRRDLLFQEIPVVVLSWKEDFLQRMQELSAGADEYMLKDVDRGQILLGISRVLAPRRELERRVGGGGEVFGRVEATGVVPILRAVAAKRRNARVVVRETWNLFEVDVQDERIVNVTNTTAGGAYLTGTAALGLLLGVQTGRFRVTPLPESPQQTVEGVLDAALARAARPVQEMIEAVSGGAIVRVTKVVLRQEAVGPYQQVAPGQIRAVLDRLAEGDSPREIILDGVIGPQELGRIVVDLIRRGVVEKVESPPRKKDRPSASEDERRWAVIGGAVAAPSLGGEDQGERVSIPTPMPPGPTIELPQAPPTERQGGPPPLPQRGGRSRTWIHLALVLLAALAVAKLWGGDERVGERRQEPPDPVGRVATANLVLDDIRVEVESECADAEAQAPEAAPPPAEEHPAEEAGEVLPAARGERGERRRDERSAEQTETGRRQAPDAGRRRDRGADRPAPEPADGPEVAAGSADATTHGTLRVLAPSGLEGVEVLVNGEFRGVAPLTLQLAPGMYGVQFRTDERTSFAAIRIEAGRTETRTPRMAR